MRAIEQRAEQSQITHVRLSEEIGGVDRSGTLPTDAPQRRLGPIEGITIAHFSKRKRERKPAINPDQIRRTQEGVNQPAEPGSRQEQRRKGRLVESATREAIETNTNTFKGTKQIVKKKINES